MTLLLDLVTPQVSVPWRGMDCIGMGDTCWRKFLAGFRPLAGYGLHPNFVKIEISPEEGFRPLAGSGLYRKACI